MSFIQSVIKNIVLTNVRILIPLLANRFTAYSIRNTTFSGISGIRKVSLDQFLSLILF